LDTTRRVGAHTLIFLAAILLAGVLTVRAHAEAAPPTVVALVNDEPITSADLDAVLIDMHRTSDMRQKQLDETEILEKAIHDRLLLQEAAAMGLSRDPAAIAPAEARREEAAIKAYVRATFAFDDSIGVDVIREYFDTYYWKIQIHQLTTPTDAELRALIPLLRAGASWDSLARIHSVDSHQYRGGRHNLKYWLDVEESIRKASLDVPLGDLSEPFDYYDMVSVIRIDERQGVDEEKFSDVEAGIRAYFQSTKREEAWNAYLDEHLQRTPVALAPGVRERILSDSSLVLRPEFLIPTPAPALVLDDEYVVSEIDLRQAVARSAKTDGTQPFATHLRQAIDDASRRLALRSAARTGGYFDDPTALARYRKDLDVALIEAYLQEAVVPRVVFNRDEFKQYYDENQASFLSPSRVQLATLMVDDEAMAKEMATRLREGADFTFIQTQYIGPESEGQQSEPRWATETSFSNAIRGQLSAMEVGSSSEPVDVGHGWMVFKLLGREGGTPKSMEEVEPEIRQVMFRRKFKEDVDELLELLEQRSRIVLNEDAIATYFNPGS
jgi:parvulin-like peptidyl-prolyl isomerase